MQSIEIKNHFNESDFQLIYQFIAKQSYWAQGIPEPTLRKALKHSWCFIIMDNQQFIGFARVVTDRATFANLLDVFVLPEFRGLNYGKHLIQHIVQQPELESVRRFTLATHDAHNLYRRFGFELPEQPEFLMEIRRPHIYQETN